MQFSERHGYSPVRSLIQIEQIDQTLKNSIWNLLTTHFWSDVLPKTYSLKNPALHMLLRNIWRNFYKLPFDDMPYDLYTAVRVVRGNFFDEATPWFRIYDFLEFLAQSLKSNVLTHKKLPFESFINVCNYFLQKDMSGYRFINGVIAPITTEVEMEEIEIGINKGLNSQFSGMSAHLKQALSLLSDRKSPDFRNSIKESISAVESVCKVVTNNPKASLGDALKKLDENGIKLHPSLKESFNKLYGYTSDEKGIRHALMDGNSTVNFDDAKYMLVSCSSFCNYLITKSNTT